MRTQAASLVVLALMAGSALADLTAFRSWARQHGKAYTAAEERRRAAIFEQNMRAAAELSKENPLATFGATKFSDLTQSEFRRFNNLAAPRSAAADNKDEVIPDDVDTTSDMVNMLPGVKDQGSCGSCYAFSAVANAEGRTFKKTGKVISLSEQHIVACDVNPSTTYPYGCNGGLMTQVDQWILEDQGGLALEEDFPYVGLGGNKTKCQPGELKWAATFESSIDFAKLLDDGKIIEALDEYGPLSIGLVSSSILFQTYKKGIIDNKSRCGKNPDHGVTLVGYGTDAESGVKYWKVRNSWGPKWGESGHVRIARGNNICAINQMISTIV